MEKAIPKVVPLSLLEIGNPMHPTAFGSSYDRLLAQLRARLLEQGIDAQILTLLRNAAGNALEAQNLVLSRPERERILQAVMKDILDRVVGQMDQGSHA